VTVTLTIEEYRDLKARSVTPEEWKARKEKLNKVAIVYMRQVMSVARNPMETSSSADRALSEFQTAVENFTKGDSEL